MTNDDIKKIEETLNVSLPYYCKQALLDYPFPEWIDEEDPWHSPYQFDGIVDRIITDNKLGRATKGRKTL